MSLGEFKFWLAHGGDLEYDRWREVWALEREHQAEQEWLQRTQAPAASRRSRNGWARAQLR
jgi:hypothetical protein